ncbi:MAG: DNA polymerase III subunit delta [Gammaproteobacteria bacterium]
MKIYPDKLSQHTTSKKFLPLYLISSDEPLLAEEAKQKLLDALKQNGYEYNARLIVETGFDWGSVTAGAQNLSLFSNKKCMTLRVPQWKLDKKGKDALVYYAQNTNDETVLIIIGPKMDKNIQSQKWMKTLESKGGFIQCWPIEIQQLPRWIMQRATQMQLHLTQEQAKRIAVMTEGNLTAAVQECEKLSLLNTNITDALLEETLSNSSQFDIFKLADTCLLGYGKRAYRMVDTLKQQGEEPVLLLWALAKDLRTLAKIYHDKKNRQPLAKSFTAYGVWDKRKPCFQQYLRQHDEEQCLTQLKQTHLIDKMIKGILPGDVWEALLELCLMIAGKNMVCHP